MNSKIERLSRNNLMTEYERDFAIGQISRRTFDNARKNYHATWLDVFKSRMSFTSGEMERSILITSLALLAILFIAFDILTVVLYFSHFA